MTKTCHLSGLTSDSVGVFNLESLGPFALQPHLTPKTLAVFYGIEDLEQIAEMFKDKQVLRVGRGKLQFRVPIGLALEIYRDVIAPYHKLKRMKKLLTNSIHTK